MRGRRVSRNSRRRLLFGFILVAGLIGLAAWLWDDRIKDHVIPRKWIAVEENYIYRSGQLSATLVERTLRDHGIKVIVALNGEAPGHRDQEAERKAAEKLGIELLRFPLRGNGTGEVDHYVEAIAAVVRARRQGRPVLVHCSAGAQRTGGVIACYQLLVQGKSPPEVLRDLKQGGWKSKDVALLDYVNENLATIATTLFEQNLIAQIPDPMPVLPVAGRRLARVQTVPGDSTGVSMILSPRGNRATVSCSTGLSHTGRSTCPRSLPSRSLG